MSFTWGLGSSLLALLFFFQDCLKGHLVSATATLPDTFSPLARLVVGPFILNLEHVCKHLPDGDMAILPSPPVKRCRIGALCREPFGTGKCRLSSRGRESHHVVASCMFAEAFRAFCLLQLQLSLGQLPCFPELINWAPRFEKSFGRNLATQRVETPARAVLFDSQRDISFGSALEINMELRWAPLFGRRAYNWT